MNVVHLVTMALLSAAALMTSLRLVRGPTEFDRILAVDVLSVLLVSAIAVFMAAGGGPAYATLTVVIALLGFVGSVTAARLAGKRHGAS
ncbi:monovalent cation/H+ antiporter complex subunit F [Actinomadura sp. SCN-SB]|uniref:monovalent cation/H+ antiporter complex subunit F n=1 Tax=Actinomadura sp. SCN-SB TaxID=3373092 RepID=UPI003751A821